MAIVQEVVIVVKGDDKEIDSTLSKLEKLGTIDKNNAEQFKKTQKEFQDALKKRNTRIEQLQQRLGKLALAQGKAFDPKRIERINKIIKQTQKEVDTLGGKFEKQAKKTNQSLSKVDTTLQKIGNRIIAAFAVSKVIGFTKDIVMMAAELEGVQMAFDRLNQPGLLNNLRKATKGTVSDLELMKNAVQAKNFQVPLEKLGTFFEFARRRAKQTGEAVDFLVNSIILGIGRKSPLILDNLGISAVALREEFKKTGDTVKAMSNIIAVELGKMGEDVDTTTEKVQRFSASWDNFKTRLGQNIAPAIGESLDFLTEKFLTSNEQADALFGEESVQEAKDWAKGTGEAVDVVAKRFQTSFIEAAKAQIEGLRGSVRFLFEEAAKVGAPGSASREDALAKARKESERLIESTTKDINSRKAQIKVLDIYIKSLTKTTEEEEKEVSTLSDLRKELKILKILREDTVPGSEKAIALSKEITRVENQITIATGKQTEAIKNLNKEREKAGDIFLKQLDDEEEALEDRIKAEDEFFDKELTANIARQKLAADTQKEKIDAITAGVEEETRKLKEGDEQFKLIVEQGEKTKEDVRQKFRDDRIKAEDKTNKELEEKEEESLRRRAEKASMSVDFISNLRKVAFNNEIQGILDQEAAVKNQLDQELKNEKLTKEQKVELRETADEELKKLRKERAEADKKQAKFNVVLNTAQGIVAALASVPPNVPLSIAIAAIGGTELAVINSEPIPEFAKGTKKVKGGQEGKDSVLAWLMPKEAVIPVDKNTRYSGPVSDIIDGKFHKNYMHKDEIIEMENSFAKNVANSYALNDENILFALQQGRRQEKKLTNAMVNAMVGAINKSNQRRFKY